jgi:ribosomal protein S18 acetylase RimI-like enzyme
MIIRQANYDDKNDFIKFTVRLSEFNRSNHSENSKYDEYRKVLSAIKDKASKIFESRDENILILIVESEGKSIGYALGRIYEEDQIADNGTGQIGLFDELYLDSEARGHGLGQKILDEMIKWFKSNDIRRIKLHAYSWNKKAKELYEKNGFKEYAVSYEKFI